MKKAASTSSADRLGTKRHCPKCATKFYDFNKEEIQCPKCGADIDTSVEASIPAMKPALAEPKKPVRAISSDDESSEDEIASSSEFESIDDLEDDEEEDIVEDLPVVDDGDDEDEDEY